MKLLSCHVVNFGCLHDLRLTFSDGINLIYAENGAGKTTLVAFIKAMLYGLPAGTRITDVTKNERLRYLPWSGGRYGGSLTFAIPEGVFRVERFFGAKAKDDTLVVYDNEKNTETDRFGLSIGDTLFAVDEEGFERTLYISQRLPGFDPDNATIRTRLGTLTRTADDLGDFTDADSLLNTAVKRYQNGRSAGKLADLAALDERTRQAILREEERAAEHGRLRGEVERLRAERAEAVAELASLGERKKAAADRRLRAEQRASYLRLRFDQDQAMRELLGYEELFGECPPTNEELSEGERLLAEGEAARAKEASAALAPELADRLAALRAVYGAPPSEEVLSALQAAEDEARRADERIAENAPRHTEAIKALSAVFPQGVPTAEETDRLREALGLLRDAKTATAEAAGGRSALWVLPFALLAALTGVGGALALSIPALSAVLFSICGLSLLGIGILLLLPRIRRRHLYRALAEARAALAPFLERYVTNEKEADAAEAMLSDAERLSALIAEDDERMALVSDFTACREAARATLRERTEAYHFADGEIPPVHRIRAEGAELTHLLTAEGHALAESRAQAEKAVSAEQALAKLLARYPSIASLSPREALSHLRESLSSCRKAAETVKKSGAALQDFLEKSGYDPAKPLEPQDEDDELLYHKEREISARISQGTADIATYEERLFILSDSLAELDRLRAERAALDETRRAAAHTHALLLQTKEILTAAKVDLTTRYLRHMEKSFSSYMSHLSDADAPYLFDAEMRLLTERQGERRSVEHLSRGQRDLALFCARLSLVDAVFRAEPPFYILDDPFVNLDDTNYQKASALLATLAEQRQILLTVCTEARMPAGAHALSLTV